MEKAGVIYKRCHITKYDYHITLNLVILKEQPINKVLEYKPQPGFVQSQFKTQI